MQLTITIDIKELIYDIQNKTYLTGRSRCDGKNYRQVALMQANDDDENYNQIMRSIGNAFARVQNELSEVLDVATYNCDNHLELSDTARAFSLQMPSNFNSAATAAIAAAIHGFIVTSATAEWFMITNKTDTEDYGRQAEESLKLLRESLCKRSRPTRSTDKDTLSDT